MYNDKIYFELQNNLSCTDLLSKQVFIVVVDDYRCYSKIITTLNTVLLL